MRRQTRSAACYSLAAAMTLQASTAAGNVCAVPSTDGAVAISAAATVVDNYWPGSTASLAVGATSVAVGAARIAGGTAIAVGDLVLIVQMQGAQFDTGTVQTSTAYGSSTTTGRGLISTGLSGDYEYVRATSAVSAAGGTLTFTGGGGGGLIKAYANAAAVAVNAGPTTGPQRYQIIRIPQYRTLNLTGSITASPWNGVTGGIAAFDVADLFAFNGTVTVATQGFRGGGGQTNGGSAGATNTDYRIFHSGGKPVTTAHGSKGEGIAGTPYRLFDGSVFLLNAIGTDIPAGSAARGSPANAGGGGTDGNPVTNDYNTGGGGGANGGDGGRGGAAWCPNGVACSDTGGLGGTAIATNGQALLILGGGGGAGTTNDGTGTPVGGVASSGSVGGGAILIRAGKVTGVGTLIADGQSANNTVLNDGTGGGGAGGTIQFEALTSTASITASAKGGNGGTNTGNGAPHGPGGGGGGGAVVSNLSLLGTVTGGNNGTTAGGIAYNAVAGSSGFNASLSPASVPGVSSGSECTIGLTKSFTPATALINPPPRLRITFTNPNPTLAMAGLALTDTYPANMVTAATPAITNTCSGTPTTTASTFAIAAGTIPPAASCYIETAVNGTAVGTYVNTLAIAAASAAVPGSTASSSTNAVAASATYTVNQGLQIVKTLTTLRDDLNAFTNPKAIPGALMQYSLKVTNPSGGPIDSGTIIVTDLIPATLSMVVGSDYAAFGYPNARGPAQFVDGSPTSGCDLVFTSLTSTTDGIDFSSAARGNPSAWTYTPTAAPTTLIDSAVTAVRFKMSGVMAAGSSFTVNFLVMVN